VAAHEPELDLPSRRIQHLKTAASVLMGLLFLAGMAWVIHKFATGKTEKKPGLQQIALIKQPPPPPPKPPEKPPEPPKIKEEVKVDQPKPDDPKPAEPKNDDPKPASDKPLGVDADGKAGSDGFGLVGNKGGRDLTSTGGGGSGRYYTGLLQRNFFEALARNRKAPLQEFSVVVSILLGEDGRVQRADIVTSSGNAEIDSLIQATLAEMPALREVPPTNMRQVQLRLNRRA
jgi:outer membrane biosynthesis protein TonB